MGRKLEKRMITGTQRQIMEARKPHGLTSRVRVLKKKGLSQLDQSMVVDISSCSEEDETKSECEEGVGKDFLLKRMGEVRSTAFPLTQGIRRTVAQPGGNRSNRSHRNGLQSA